MSVSLSHFVSFVAHGVVTQTHTHTRARTHTHAGVVQVVRIGPPMSSLEVRGGCGVGGGRSVAAQNARKAALAAASSCVGTATGKGPTTNTGLTVGNVEVTASGAAVALNIGEISSRTDIL